MPSRRAFLKHTAALAAVGAGLPSGNAGAAAGAEQVPDTLDLAEHGRMAINGMLGSLNPALDYESVFKTILDVHPPYMLHWSTQVSGVMPKFIEALPMLRQMSGSNEHQDLQDGFMNAMLKRWPTMGWSMIEPTPAALGT